MVQSPATVSTRRLFQSVRGQRVQPRRIEWKLRNRRARDQGEGASFKLAHGSSHTSVIDKGKLQANLLTLVLERKRRKWIRGADAGDGSAIQWVCARGYRDDELRHSPV